MEKRYNSNTKKLNDAKSKGMSNKAKLFIATALIAGNLTVIGNPLDAKAYTDEQLIDHSKHVQEVENHYNNILEKSYSRLNDLLVKGQISIKTYEETISKLKRLEDSGKQEVYELSGKLTHIYDKNLVFMKTLPSQDGDTKTRIDLTLNDISSLNKQQIEYLEKKYHINSVILNRFYDIDAGKGEFTAPLYTYSVETYKTLLTKIDEKFADLKSNKTLSELEKTLVVLKRLENIKYDFSALYTQAYTQTQDSSIQKVWTSRNMIDPLLNDTAICGGYSDLFKNIMSYLNIEAKEIRGYLEGSETINTIPGEANHSWNQVKVNGNWYNLDVTEININTNILKPNKSHPFLLVSDSQFNKERSEFSRNIYQPLLGLHENATQSISQQEIDNALLVAINYEQKRSKRAHSFSTSLKNMFTKKSSNNNNSMIIDTPNTSKNDRDKFIAELSNNGEYGNTSNIETTKDHSKKNNSLEYDSDERI